VFLRMSSEFSLVVGAPKHTTKYDGGDVETLLLHWSPISKKQTSNEWWSSEVIELLLELHLEYTKDFDVGMQVQISMMKVRPIKNPSMRENTIIVSVC
jgi:hypothetical protein